MSLDEQIQLSALLKAHCADATHGEDARKLLTDLRQRPDIALVVADDIDHFMQSAVPLATSDAAPRRAGSMDQATAGHVRELGCLHRA